MEHDIWMEQEIFSRITEWRIEIMLNINKVSDSGDFTNRLRKVVGEYVMWMISKPGNRSEANVKFPGLWYDINITLLYKKVKYEIQQIAQSVN